MLRHPHSGPSRSPAALFGRRADSTSQTCGSSSTGRPTDRPWPRVGGGARCSAHLGGSLVDGARPEHHELGVHRFLLFDVMDDGQDGVAPALREKLGPLSAVAPDRLHLLARLLAAQLAAPLEIAQSPLGRPLRSDVFLHFAFATHCLVVACRFVLPCYRVQRAVSGRVLPAAVPRNTLIIGRILLGVSTDRVSAVDTPDKKLAQ